MRRPRRESELVNAWLQHPRSLVAGCLLIMMVPAMLYAVYKALAGDAGELVAIAPVAIGLTVSGLMAYLFYRHSKAAHRERLRSVVQSVRGKARQPSPEAPVCVDCGAEVADPEWPCPACGRPWPLKSLEPEKKYRPIHRIFGYALGFLLIWAVVALSICLYLGFPRKSEDVVLLVIASGGIAGFVVICGILGIGKARASRRRKRIPLKQATDTARKHSPDR